MAPMDSHAVVAVDKSLWMNEEDVHSWVKAEMAEQLRWEDWFIVAPNEQGRGCDRGRYGRL